MFLHKQPCVVPRLLDEASCPPDGPHIPADYPLYYDPLYYPHEHVSIFETPIKFVTWLSKSLKSHHVHCVNCELEFVGCILFDDYSLKVSYAPYRVCLTKSPEYFASANYMHCLLLSELKGVARSPPLNIAACVARQMDRLPSWLQYSESIYMLNLLRLKRAQKMPSSPPYSATFTNFVFHFAVAWPVRSLNGAVP
ncbi:hypothetical protein EDC04DRAFT_2798063 [Pisolithus marmoratus]|nr:hypothetical protein EDC04DRAFT_2798063 [Pisolithus marmoratus]